MINKIILIGLFSNLAVAQITLKGKVVDQNNNPIAFTTVSLVTNVNGAFSGIGGVTNLKGEFSITAEDSWNSNPYLLFQALGAESVYKPHNIKYIQGENPTRFNLRPVTLILKSNQLDEIPLPDQFWNNVSRISSTALIMNEIDRLITPIIFENFYANSGVWTNDDLENSPGYSQLSQSVFNKKYSLHKKNLTALIASLKKDQKIVTLSSLLYSLDKNNSIIDYGYMVVVKKSERSDEVYLYSTDRILRKVFILKDN